MIKDAIGNDIQIGDTVHVAGPNGTWIVGIVTQLQNGGISFIANPAKNHNQPMPTTPDVVLIQAAFPLAGVAGMPHEGIVKLAAKNVVDKITESSVKM